MILYHWTNVVWLEAIVTDGFIKTTASDIAGPQRAALPNKATWREYRHPKGMTPETEPKVVWLANNPLVDASYLGVVDAIHGLPVDARMAPPEWRKTRVRITVDVPDADVQWWPRFARQRRMNEKWYQAMARGHRDPKEWFVVLRPIPLAEIIRIDLDGSQVWPSQRKLSVLDAVKAWLGKS